MRNQKKGGNLSSVNDIGFVVFCERIEMKNWTKPEIKMYGIRMDENIASSVGGSVRPRLWDPLLHEYTFPLEVMVDPLPVGFIIARRIGMFIAPA